MGRNGTLAPESAWIKNSRTINNISNEPWLNPNACELGENLSALSDIYWESQKKTINFIYIENILYSCTQNLTLFIVILSGSPSTIISH